MRYRVTGKDFAETHYCNVLSDGTILDTTGSQYKEPVTLRVDPISSGPYANAREKYLAQQRTREQYDILRKRVMAALK